MEKHMIRDLPGCGAAIMQKRSEPITCSLCILVLLVACTPVTASTDPTPQMNGGSIYFETDPTGASIWLGDTNIGTTPFTYYVDSPGTLEVRVQKKYYREYSGSVTVSGGERKEFFARLDPLPDALASDTPPPEVTTVAVKEKSIVKSLPTPWPTTTAQSPVDPALAIAALATGIVVCVFRR